MKDFAQLLCITTDRSDFSHFEQVKILINQGAKFIQLRSKTLSAQELQDQAHKASNYASSKNVMLIINDFVEIARYVNASGVHIGKSDNSVVNARRILGDDLIIGSTVHNLSEAIEVKRLGLSDYVGLGPYRESATKGNLEPFLTKPLIHEIIELLYPIPVFLIGGIGLADCCFISEYNISGVAVCSGLSTKTLYGGNVSEFNNKINEFNSVVV